MNVLQFWPPPPWREWVALSPMLIMSRATCLRLKRAWRRVRMWLFIPNVSFSYWWAKTSVIDWLEMALSDFCDRRLRRVPRGNPGRPQILSLRWVHARVSQRVHHTHAHQLPSARLVRCRIMFCSCLFMMKLWNAVIFFDQARCGSELFMIFTIWFNFIWDYVSAQIPVRWRAGWKCHILWASSTDGSTIGWLLRWVESINQSINQ